MSGLATFPHDGWPIVAFATPQSPGRLSEEESGFVADAAALILPEPLHAGERVDMVGFLECLLASAGETLSECQTDQKHAEPIEVSSGMLKRYREGIAAVQHYCAVTHGLAFQELSLGAKHLVLSLLEDGCREAGFQEHAGLFRLLVLHASEAYFDATQVGLRLRHG